MEISYPLGASFMDFKKEKEKSIFYSPSEDSLQEKLVEIRYDPLTGKTSRIIDDPMPINKEDPDMSDVEKDGFCPLCPENIYDVGVRDVRVLSKEIEAKGECVLLSNLTPYAENSLVLRLTEKHYLELDEFTTEHFADALELIQRYAGELEEKCPERRFINIFMNYLKPAGSSIVHPHMQTIVSKEPTDHQRRMLDSARSYHERNGSNYWEDLIEEERGGPRSIGDRGETFWMTAFAPRGFEHVKGIILEDLLDIRAKTISKIAEGIINTLEYYKKEGYNSFNFAMTTHPLKGSAPFATVIDMVTRSNLDKFYWCDVSSLSKLQDEALIDRRPERTAEDVRSSFNKQ